MWQQYSLERQFVAAKRLYKITQNIGHTQSVPSNGASIMPAHIVFNVIEMEMIAVAPAMAIVGWWKWRFSDHCQIQKCYVTRTMFHRAGATGKNLVFINLSFDLRRFFPSSFSLLLEQSVLAPMLMLILLLLVGIFHCTVSSYFNNKIQPYIHICVAIIWVKRCISS